jgi:hypothetical protein
MSTLRPTEVRTSDIFRDPGTLHLLATILETLGYLNPDPQVWQDATQTTAASITAIRAFEPPDAVQEFEILAARIIMNNNIDGADVTKIYYSDLVSALNFNLAAGTVTQLGGVDTALTWPAAIESNTGLTVSQLVKNVIVKLKPTKEPFKRLNFSLTTTATVGSRSWTPQVLYQARQRLNT